MSLVEKIEESFVNFSPKERLIATYLLQEQRTIGNINIQELSAAVGSSPSTITRFCRKVGCESFVELKIELQSISGGNVVKTEGPFEMVTQYYNRVIERTAQLIDSQQIKRTIDLLQTANRIVIYGIGSSGLTAKEFAIRLSRMGLNAIAEADAHMIIIGSKVTSKGDVVIGFSNSGETKEVVHALNNAKQNGASIICVTSMKGSTITEVSDETFYVHSSRFVNNDHFANSQLSFYYLIDLITLELLENSTFASNMKLTIDEILQNSNYSEEEK